MQLTSPPFWILPFSKRQLGVSLHSVRGIVVFDPAGQRNVPSDRARIYVAKENRLFLLLIEHLTKHLSIPKSEKQAWLGVRTYSAFLNPAIPRPTQIDSEPSHYSSTPVGYYLTEDRVPCEACHGTGTELTASDVGTGMLCSYCGGTGYKP